MQELILWIIIIFLLIMHIGFVITIKNLYKELDMTYSCIYDLIRENNKLKGNDNLEFDYLEKELFEDDRD